MYLSKESSVRFVPAQTLMSAGARRAVEALVDKIYKVWFFFLNSSEKFKHTGGKTSGQLHEVLWGGTATCSQILLHYTSAVSGKLEFSLSASLTVV